MTKPMREEAITDLYSSSFPKTLCIADLGCSSGPNTLLVLSELIQTVHKIRQKLGHQSPEFIIYLNDLPGNDFNTIFRSLPKFYSNLKANTGSEFGPCVINGVPGSFYDRLFASKSLHFLHSSYSLMWLSQVWLICFLLCWIYFSHFFDHFFLFIQFIKLGSRRGRE